MAIPLLIVNHRSAVPPYDQISLQISMLIAKKEVPPGMLLPPVRQLAEDLGVAPNTVIRAYDELERDGWVVRAARKGVAVVPEPPVIHETRRERLTQAVSDLLEIAQLLDMSATEMHEEIDRQINTLRSAPAQ